MPIKVNYNYFTLYKAFSLTCFDTVFQRPYRYFSIALKVILSLSAEDITWCYGARSYASYYMPMSLYYNGGIMGSVGS